MNIYRMLVVAGIVLIQVNGANAQFGGLGNLINKKLNKPANPPPTADSNATPTNQPSTDQPKATTDTVGTNSANDSGTVSNPQIPPVSGGETSTLNLPPIFEAARQCDGVRFAELLKKDMSSINETVDRAKPGDYGEYGDYTLLKFAAENGCTNIIQQLLDLEVAVDGVDGGAALTIAAGNGHLEAVKMLLKAKVFLAAASIGASCEKGRVEVLKALIDAGGAVNGDNLETAAKNGNAELVQVVLKRMAGGDPKKKYQHSLPPFYQQAFCEATAKGNLSVVKVFVADDADLGDNDDLGKAVIRSAIQGNQPEIVAYLKEAKKTQEAAKVEKEAAIAKEEAAKEAARLKEQEAKKAAANEALQKQVLALLDHPKDLFEMANSRYRKFNGKVYDCAEPIEFLNRLYAFLPVEGQYHDNPDSLKEIKDRVEAESKWVHENPWYKIQNDCSMIPVQVKQVISDGLIVQLNDASLVLLKNHPKQKIFVDGDVMGAPTFVIKTSPYQYTDVLGAVRTIPSYDLGVVVPAPSGSVPKLPLPEASH